MSKIINSVLEHDSSIKAVGLIVDARSVRQNDLSQNIIDVLDIIDNDAKDSIREEVNKTLAEKTKTNRNCDY